MGGAGGRGTKTSEVLAHLLAAVAAWEGLAERQGTCESTRGCERAEGVEERGWFSLLDQCVFRGTKKPHARSGEGLDEGLGACGGLAILPSGSRHLCPGF